LIGPFLLNKLPHLNFVQIWYDQVKFIRITIRQDYLLAQTPPWRIIYLIIFKNLLQIRSIDDIEMAHHLMTGRWGGRGKQWSSHLETLPETAWENSCPNKAIMVYFSKKIAIYHNPYQ